MAEEEVVLPHGMHQQMKMELLGMIHGGESPYKILHRMAERLGEECKEPTYAPYVKEQIRAVYGFALGEPLPLEEELAEVAARLERIKASKEREEFTEEEKIRMKFAIDLHKKNIARLEWLIQKAKMDEKMKELKMQ